MKTVILRRFILVSEKPCPRQLVLQETSSGPLVVLRLLFAGRTVKNQDKGADPLRDPLAEGVPTQGYSPNSSAQPVLQGRFLGTALGTIKTASEAARLQALTPFIF